MNTNKLFQILGLAAMTALSACGGGDPPAAVIPNGYGYGAGLGNCTLPPGVKDKTVVGSLDGGATLTLDIYGQPSGTIAAIGEINIPNVASLFQTGMPTTSATGLPGNYRRCVSSNGSVGVIDRTSTYQDIEIALQGDGIYIEMGSRYGVPTYITGDSLEGTIYIELAGQAPATFTMTRP